MSRLKNRRGQGLVEYILLVALVAVSLIGVVKMFTTNAQLGYTTETAKLAQAW